MRYPEPILSTDTVGGVTRVIARYETPETARMMLSLRTLTAGSVFVGLAAAAFWLINRMVMTNQMWMLAVVVAIIAAFGLAQLLADFLYRHRFFARRMTDDALRVDLSRKSVAHDGQSYARGGVLRFTALPHRAGHHEDRDERIKERLLPTVYREAFQVWLQHGEDFALLANVSDDRGAAAIIRRLQEVDEGVQSGSGEGGSRPFGLRNPPL